MRVIVSHRTPTQLSRPHSESFGSGKLHGFTLFEFAVVVTLVGVLSAVLITRVQFYQQQAELVAVEQTVATLRAALRMKETQASLAGAKAGRFQIADENPVGWLLEKPKNYLGEYYAPETGTLLNGNWYFDRSDKSLVYLFTPATNFATETSKVLRFKVKLPLVIRDSTAMATRSTPIAGLELVQVQTSDQAALTVQVSR